MLRLTPKTKSRGSGGELLSDLIVISLQFLQNQTIHPLVLIIMSTICHQCWQFGGNSLVLVAMVVLANILLALYSHTFQDIYPQFINVEEYGSEFRNYIQQLLRSLNNFPQFSHSSLNVKRKK